MVTVVGRSAVALERHAVGDGPFRAMLERRRTVLTRATSVFQAASHASKRVAPVPGIGLDAALPATMMGR